MNIESLEGATRQPLAKPLDVLRPDEFLADFQAETGRTEKQDSQSEDASNRIWLQAMYLEFFGTPTRTMYKILRKAGESGDDIRINVDGFSSAYAGELPMAQPIFNKKKRLHRGLANAFSKKRIDLLKASGVNVTDVNPIRTFKEKLLWYKNRNHGKIVLVNNIAYMGGMNFHQGEFEKEDFTVKLTDPRIINAIEAQFLRVNENRLSDNYEIACTEDTSLLYDNGTKGSSIILDRAIEVVNKAQKTVFVSSQFMPDGKFLEALHNASKRGVEVLCLQSDPAREDPIFRALNALSRLKARLKPIPD